MNRTVKIIWNTVTWILIGVILLVALLATVPSLFGIHPLTVLTPSMSHLNEDSDIKAEDLKGSIGQLPTGSLIYVKSVDVEDIKQYDVVTIKIEGGYLTHRVIELVTAEDGRPALRTQGDANTTPDGVIVTEANIVGKVVFSIPYLGGIIQYIKTPPGLYLGIAALCFLLLFVFMPDIVEFLMKKEGPEAAAAGEGAEASAAPTSPETTVSSEVPGSSEPPAEDP